MTQWQPLIDKIVAKISSWTARKLSYAGRVQLIRTVLFGVQSYWSQIFLMPSKVIKLIEAYCRSFMWSGTNVITKRALISWDKVCQPKSAGGLNILNLKSWNKAAILKLQWDLATKADKLWIKWIHMYYIKGHSLDTVKVPKQASWMVQKIRTVAGLNTQMQGDNGKCRIKQLYLQQIGALPKVEWKTIMFSNLATPKALFSMWLIIQERMMTTDRLNKWNINVDPICVLCGNHPETHAHLFWECTNKNVGSAWFVEKAKKKTVEGQLLRMVLAENLYSIWTERNHRVFEKAHKDTKSIITEIAYTCNVWAEGKLKEVLQQRLL
ncbi:PREDICTED: uncharacterized protein LOC109234906 [Nicotiana attenuata]|uniref:uncharacterized protein LOC109234906 n=1 Tax=Nicotiana attenuata TaxID=49451 RepID=UPI0009046CED|nr:PREDICTED: uncharacterized protein LOC109234906 [Nicotiana attenuata]